MYDRHHSRSDKCRQQIAEVSHSVSVMAYHLHKSKIRGVSGHCLGEYPQNRSPTRVRVIALHSLDTASEVLLPVDDLLVSRIQGLIEGRGIDMQDPSGSERGLLAETLATLHYLMETSPVEMSTLFPVGKHSMTHRR